MITRTLAYSFRVPETMSISKTDDFDSAFRAFQILRACDTFYENAHGNLRDPVAPGWTHLLTGDVKQIRAWVVNGCLVSGDDLKVLRNALLAALDRIPVPAGAFRSVEETIADGVKAINWLLQSHDE